MAATIRPLHDRVLIQRIDEAEQVRGGIIIPDTAKEKPQQGEVMAVGDGKINEDGTRRPPDVKRLPIAKQSTGFPRLFSPR